MKCHPLLAVILLIFIGALLYAGTIGGPFLPDCNILIANNPIIKNLDYILHPSLAKGHNEYGALVIRYATFVTFALNYRFNGLDVRGYHAVSLAFHIFAALGLWMFVRVIFRTPFLAGSALSRWSEHIALASAGLFIAHPVNTEAVNYIVQRFVPMSGGFYIWSLTLYLMFRMSDGFRAKALLALSIISAALAYLSKENSATLPFAMLLCAVFFFDGKPGRRYLLPFFVMLAWFPFALSESGTPALDVLGLGSGDTVAGTSRFAQDYLSTGDSRWEYLITQFRVLVTYLRMLALPVGQSIDHNYPVISGLTMSVALSGLIHIGLLGLAARLFVLSRMRAELRIISFGLIWFYMTILIESSVIPIPIIMTEYRMYLPGSMLMFAFVVAVLIIFQSYRPKDISRWAVISVAAAFVLFSTAAYARNIVWQSPVSIWLDAAVKSPDNGRAHLNLSNAYESAGEGELSEKHLMRALELPTAGAVEYNNLGMKAFAQNNAEAAIKYYGMALKADARYAEAYNNMGMALASLGRTEEARANFLKAGELDRSMAEVWYNLGVLEYSSGGLERALGYASSAIALKPEYGDAYRLMGLALSGLNKPQAAMESFERALLLMPDSVDLLNDSAIENFRLGRSGRSVELLKLAVNIAPEHASSRLNLGIVYLETGQMQDACEMLKSALRVEPENGMIMDVLRQNCAG